MSPLGYDQETADALLNIGAITPETYDQAKAAGEFTSPVGGATTPVLPTEAPSTELGTLPQMPQVPQAHQASEERANLEAAMAPFGAQPPVAGGMSAEQEGGQIRMSPSNLAIAQPAGQTETLPVSPMQGMYDQAFGKIRAGTEGQAAAQQRAGEAQALEISNMQARAEQRMEAEKGLEEAHQAAMRLHLDRIEDESDELKKTEKIDPRRVWNSKGTPAKIMAIIGLAMGGFGAALNRGPNYAMDILNREVDRDIDAQKEEHAAKRGALADKINVYGLMRQQFGDDKNARLATQAAYNDLLKMKFQQIAATAQSEEARARGMQLSGQIDMQQAQIKNQLDQNMRQRQMMNQATGGGIPEQAYNYLNPEQQKNAVKMPNGKLQVAFPGEADKVRAGAAAHGEFNAILNKMQALNQGGTALPFTERKHEAEALRLQAMATLKKMEEAGKFSENTTKILEEQIPDATSMLTHDASVKIKQVKAFNDTRMEQLYKQSLPGYKGINFTPH